MQSQPIDAQAKPLDVFRDTLEHLNQGVSYFDADMRLVVCNKRFLDLLDFPGSMGRPGTPADAFFRFNAERGEYGDGDIDEMVSVRLELARQKIPHRIERARPDGRILLIEGNPIEGGGFVTTYSDITELRHAQVESQKLSELYRADQERFRDFAEVGADWFWEMDRDCRFTLITGHVYASTGLTPNQFIGHTRAEVYARSQPQLLNVWAKKQTEVEAEKPFADVEMVWQRPDGVRRTIALSGRPFYGPDGQLEGYRGVGRDVTHQKLIEWDLAESAAAAEKANKAKSEFLAQMSHELRTPLNAIIGFSELIGFGDICQDLEHARSCSEHVLTASRHLLNLVNDILDISKIEASEISVAIHEVDVRRLLDGVLDLIQLEVSRKSLDVSLVAGSEAPIVLADQELLHQVCTNILSNAVKFSSNQGAIVIRVDQVDPASMAITFRDYGPGIPRSMIPKITEPFAQGLDSPMLSREGAGLGLAISKRLLEMQNGKLKIESEIGQGTTVSIYLPTPKGR